MEYQIIFESENILYVKLSEKLINDYLIMFNDPEVASKISHKVHTYTYEEFNLSKAYFIAIFF